MSKDIIDERELVYLFFECMGPMINSMSLTFIIYLWTDANLNLTFMQLLLNIELKLYKINISYKTVKLED